MDYVARQLLTSQVDGLAWMWCFGLASAGIGSLLVLWGVIRLFHRTTRTIGVGMAAGRVGITLAGVNFLLLSAGWELNTVGRLAVAGALLLATVGYLTVGLSAYREWKRR